MARPIVAPSHPPQRNAGRSILEAFNWTQRTALPVDCESANSQNQQEGRLPQSRRILVWHKNLTPLSKQ